MTNVHFLPENLPTFTPLQVTTLACNWTAGPFQAQDLTMQPEQLDSEYDRIVSQSEQIALGSTLDSENGSWPPDHCSLAYYDWCRRGNLLEKQGAGC